MNTTNKDMNMTFADYGFKYGDVVKCVACKSDHRMIGKLFRIESDIMNNLALRIGRDNCSVLTGVGCRWVKALPYEIASKGVYRIADIDHDGTYIIAREGED